MVAMERRERGSSIVEYVLLVGLIAIACIVALNMLGLSTQTGYSAATSLISAS